MRRVAGVLILAGSLLITACSGEPADTGVGGETVVATETVTVSPSTPPPTEEPAGPTGLDTVIDEVVAQFGGTAGVAVSDGQQQFTAGVQDAHPAWSTIKVPLAVAALRTDAELAPTVSAAIRISDNQAAELLWATAGPDAVDEVLAEGQAGILVNRERIRPEFSVFGQTAWSVADQARFAAHLPCIAGAGPVLTDMAAVDPAQSWGLGGLAGARFKGGWGPDLAGMYSVRQFGLVPTGAGETAVAITATPGSGAFGDAQAMATAIAQRLGEVADLPAAACG